MARLKLVSRVETTASSPRYELRVWCCGPADTAHEVWQLPATASPHVTRALRIARLRGRNLDLVKHRVTRRLSQEGIRLGQKTDAIKRCYRLTEEAALMLGLLFRTLAPMRSRERMWEVTEGIEVMGREESAYWLGMAMHRRNPRRALSALRTLLTEPQTKEPCESVSARA